jgi:subtilisin family serine protease
MIAVILLLLVTGTFGFAPILNHENRQDIVDGEYIVVFHTDVSQRLRESFERHIIRSFGENDKMIATYSIGTFNGFAAKLSDELLSKIQDSPLVKYIEYNRIVHTLQNACIQQRDADWGLDRIDDRDIVGDGSYKFTDVSGNGVDAYIIDTGIQITHVDFGGRAVWDANYVNDGVNNDCNGHGTHVAGTVGGIQYGVAKNVTLHAVKVLGCSGSGTNAGVINGINYVTNQKKARRRPALANMSLGGGANQATDDAVTQSIAAGVSYAIAAGNSNADACGYSPARTPAAVTVGATTIEFENDVREVDARSSFSNYGTCVDIFAPGELIKSDWIDQAGVPANTNTRTISGTSMASPHVAGVIALYLSLFPDATPDDVTNFVKAQATKGIIDLQCGVRTACSDSPNSLLYNLC